MVRAGGGIDGGRGEVGGRRSMLGGRGGGWIAERVGREDGKKEGRQRVSVWLPGPYP